MERSSLILGRTDGIADRLLLPIVVDSTGHLQIDLLTMPSIPAGTNRIGSAGIEGYYSGNWQKAPIPFGASSRWASSASNTNLPAGTSTLDLPALVTNAFTVLQSVYLQYSGTTTNVLLRLSMLYGGGGGYPIADYWNLTSGRGVNWSGQIVLDASDIVRATVYGATLNDDLYIYGWGYTIARNL